MAKKIFMNYLNYNGGFMLKRMFALMLAIFCMIGAMPSRAASDSYEITVSGTLLSEFNYDYTKWNNTEANRELFAAICLWEMFYADDWRLMLPFTTNDFSVSTTILVGEYASLGNVMVIALEQKEGYLFTYYDFI